MAISQELEQKIENLVQSFGCELYDIAFLKENENQILRISITKKPNLSLEDCKEVSLVLSPLLDVEMPEFEEYFLEVSSPGIERVLKNDKHYKSAIGELVKIKLLSKKEEKGKLQEVTKDSLVLEGGIIIPKAEIKKAQTYFVW
ncbi:ribosome maturation factor RimP [Helicobacter burdigaliensis]|uniref:ribosome maturation factor RimP n=1 Tax=Helicobacter burdigaliensis TaxID=2315334 RepID=UPI000EF6B7BA|nr:ribosome maturation factor RimP [Helicobacter burdigaliensis]